jgi:hypothetical protein
MALYVVAALVIGAIAYWVLYRTFVPKLIRETTGKMREWTNASTVFTEILSAHVKPGDEIGRAVQKLDRMGFKDVGGDAREQGLFINRYRLPAAFAPVLPLTIWTVQTRSDDGLHVTAVRGVASRKDD